MREELQQRENTIIELNIETNQLLSAILKYEKDLKNNEVTLQKVSFLENQLVKLQQIIENRIHSQNMDNNTACAIEIVPRKNLDNLAEVHKVTNKEAVNTKNTDEPSKQTKRIINMYSDVFGKNMAIKIMKYLPDIIQVMNNCKPGNDFAEIMKESLLENRNDEDLIMLIGNYKSLKGNPADYISKIERLARAGKNRKITVATIAYKQDKIRNAEIMKINSKLYTLASLHSNVNIVELNGVTQLKSLKGQEAVAKYIATACMHGVNRSNLILLGEDSKSHTEEKKNAPQNFPQAVKLRAVK